ncbi:MAG: hypothetical protein R3243_15960 [Arenibacter latericius]|nr:hypothetical protein [Arenibacter latericius]
MPRVELTGGFYEDDALQFDAQRCVNMYPEIGSGQSKSSAKLTYSPGLIIEKQGFKLNPAVDRFIQPLTIYKTSNNLLFYFYLYEESSGETWCEVSAIDVDGNGSALAFQVYAVVPNGEFFNIKAVDNGKVISLVVTNSDIDYDSKCFFIDINTFITTPNVTIVTDSDFPTNVIDQEYHDGYFIWLQKRGELTSGTVEDRFYISRLFVGIADAGDCLNALDFGVTESSPDSVSGIERISNELAIFGDQSIEFFYNSGNFDFPFERNSGVTQNIGTQLVNSIKKINNTVYFIGSDSNGANVVYRLNGYNPERISTHAIERRLNYLSEVDYSEFISTRCYTYEVDGHYFYCINYKRTSNQTRYNQTTFVFDISTGIWHETVYLSGEVETSLPIVDSVSFAGRTFALSTPDYTIDGGGFSIINVYSFSKESLVVPLYGGEATLQDKRMPRIRTMPHLTNENRNIIYKSLELDAQKGLSDTSPIITYQGEPITTNGDQWTYQADFEFFLADIQLSVSRDGGETFGNPITKLIGGEGEYKKRIKFDMLGMARDAVFKIESRKKIKQEWFTTYLKYEVMSE